MREPHTTKTSHYVDLSGSPTAQQRLMRAEALDVQAGRTPTLDEMAALAQQQLALEGLAAPGSNSALKNLRPPQAPTVGGAVTPDPSMSGWLK